MACDRFVNWREEAPTKEQLHDFIEGFFGSIVSFKYEQDRLFVSLPGKPIMPSCYGLDPESLPEERWIEIWTSPKDGTLDVITRQADHFTNILADGLTDRLAAWFHGDLRG